jgi:putative hydrolase of the HAD superfamily
MEKLGALGVLDLFELVLCAQDPEIGVFKPHPRGLQVAIERLGVSPLEALFVGDRPEVDAVAAAAVGVPCAIVSRPGKADERDGFVRISRLSEVLSIVDRV